MLSHQPANVSALGQESVCIPEISEFEGKIQSEQIKDLQIIKLTSQIIQVYNNLFILYPCYKSYSKPHLYTSLEDSRGRGVQCLFLERANIDIINCHYS